MIYICCDKKRRQKVIEHKDLNGIDFLEVLDKPSMPEEDRQRTLLVHFLKETGISALTREKEHFRIDGGRRIPNVQVIDVTHTEDARTLRITVDKPGDFSTYTLCLVKHAATNQGNELRNAEDDKEVMLIGSVDRLLDQGSRIRFNLRDQAGSVPVTCNPEILLQARKIALRAQRDILIQVRGKVRDRSESRGEPRLRTRQIEIEAQTLDILDAQSPPDGFDPILSSVEFSFKVQCPTEFDCQPQRSCPPEQLPEPEIDYLAKDYASFRQLLLDRMATLLHGQIERNPADLGVALVELLAYVGDQLSYRQDAIATEAYLGTARRRTSVRRHARLVDYHMHDGCNARVWMQICLAQTAPPNGIFLEAYGKKTGDKLETRPQETGDKLETCPLFLTRCQADLVLSRDNVDRIVSEQHPEVFEPLHNAMLFPAHNKIQFYTWGDERCCLPRGTTSATLRDEASEEKRLRLRPGDVLVFVERLNPSTGQSQDANPAHRQAVRLTSVKPEAIPDKDGHRTPGTVAKDPLTNDPIVEIAWAPEDALRHPFCISAKTDQEHGETYNKQISYALGNIVLADHGRSVQHPLIPASVPPATLHYPHLPEADRCREQAVAAIPARYRPRLQEGPLTHAAPFDVSKDGVTPASAAMRWNLQDALPAAALVSTKDTRTWRVMRDLLSGHANDPCFVVETEDNGIAYIRFGDGKLGKRPESGTEFEAHYRIGNGVAGNVGANTIVSMIPMHPHIERVWNPLPAVGGTEPEQLEDVRTRAPSAFRTQKRAITPEDYAERTQEFAGKPSIQRAAATFRWTGSWHTVFVTVDPVGDVPTDESEKDALHTALERHLEHYRMAGHDVEIDWPRYVPLEIELFICVKQEYFRSEVKRALLEVFSNRSLPNGQPGVFHPVNFSFGQTIYLSRIVAAAQSVPGVAAIDTLTFQRRGRPDRKAFEDGQIKLYRLEIARCDNDPNYPEHGIFRLSMGGGK